LIDHCPTTPQELFKDGMELILGEEADAAGNLDSMARVGISLMAGREEFDILLRLCGDEIRLLDSSIRMLPLKKRTFKGLEALVEWLNSRWNLRVTLENSDKVATVILPAASADKQEASTIAAFIQGLLQGMLTWISGGKFYPAHLESTARGMEIQLMRTPLD